MLPHFTRNKRVADVLVLVVGHQHPDFLSDTAESFRFYHPGSSPSYRLAFAVDNNLDCAATLAERYGHEAVYCSPQKNGWGRGIMRTIAYALDHFRRNGIHYEHLITVDSDTLIVGPCLDQYVSLIEPGVSFVGQKWGGEGPYSSANPGPIEAGQRQIRKLAKLYPDKWELVDYMVAGPFFLWTRYALDSITRLGLLPGASLDAIYPFILFPHDQITTFLLGFPNQEFRSVGKTSLLYCGDVGGETSWKSGLPSSLVEPYGQVPLVSPGVSVIHPIRSKKFEEGKVRSYFRKQRA